MSCDHSLGHVIQWANHDQSLRLEEATKKKILDRIEDKVSSGSGTWIDWQYLMDAVELLRKVSLSLSLTHTHTHTLSFILLLQCRYTLKYTYPYAYYSEGTRKDLVSLFDDHKLMT